MGFYLSVAGPVLLALILMGLCCSRQWAKKKRQALEHGVPTPEDLSVPAAVENLKDKEDQV